MIAVGLVLAFLIAMRSTRADEADDAQRIFEQWIARAREAAAIDFECETKAQRPVAGVLRSIESTLEVSIGKDGPRLFGRFIRRVAPVPGNDSPEEVTAIVLADGEHAYTLDEARQTFVRSWPPRFVGAGEGRSFLLFRAFLGEPVEEPRRVQFARGKQPDESFLEMEFRDRIESLHLDASGGVTSITKRDRAGSGTKTVFRFRRFELVKSASPYDYSCKPLGSYRDITVTVAKKAPISARISPNSPPRNAQRGTLREGDRDVDATFLTSDFAHVRLLNLRGRKLVVCFLDHESPTAEHDRLVIERLARLALRRQDPALFLVVDELKPAPSALPRLGRSLAALESSPILRRVKSARPELQAAFGVLLPPTTFVLDEDGSVILRSAVEVDEDRLRRVLGFE